MSVTIGIDGEREYQVALYFGDWNKKGCRQAVEMMDAGTLNQIAPVKIVDDFSGGAYLVYQYNKSAKFRINKMRGPLISLSGIFFDPATTRLWYQQPAAKWEEAMPVGNGRLGAMVFGGTAEERLQLNESTLWGGLPHDYSNPGAGQHLAEVRRLIFAGKINEAQELGQKMLGSPKCQRPYQPLGDLRLRFPGHEQAEQYVRSTDLDQALTTNWTKICSGSRFIGGLRRASLFRQVPKSKPEIQKPYPRRFPCAAIRRLRFIGFPSDQ